MTQAGLARITARIPQTSVLLAAALFLVGVVFWLLDAPLGIDSAVYRSGALAVMRGEPLYGPLAATPPWSPELPFTYPPIAAVLFAPLALLPPQVVWAVFAAASAVGLGVVLRSSLGAGLAAFALLLVPALEPVWRTLAFGQINIVLMALVVVDVLLLRGHKASGVLVGVAAAIKLTPLIFIAHLFLTGRRQDAVRALVTFACLNSAGFLLLPRDSITYVASALVKGNNATGNGWITNQSVAGVVQRLSGEAEWAFWLSASLCLLVTALAVVLVRSALRRDDQLVALLVTAFAGLLISPISWSHHWVWVVPLVGCLVARRRMIAAAGAAVIFVVGHGQTGILWLDNAYVLTALLLAGGVVARHLTFSPRSPLLWYVPFAAGDRPWSDRGVRLAPHRRNWLLGVTGNREAQRSCSGSRADST
ncbi:glycosyltransferase 87 family protein [Lentzea cavernae]|uniref:Membrane protein n=1 Tax=Lentzea cavernae TaxID=2020703 RepID=A0ABQ3MZT2_9PSEU|nr:glycosyltransferase 87 family protein [Lentzea cavernae]GHH61274.1 membrane protein [Lentzea cavernae]